MNEVSRFVSERVREMTDTGMKWQRTLVKLDETKKRFQEVEANMLDLLAEHRLLRTELLEFSDHVATHAHLALESIPKDELRFRYPSAFILKPEIYGPAPSSSQVERVATPAPSSTAVHRNEEHP